MPSNQTPNYQLNQWEADDRVLRTDFNADNAKIDAALAQKAAQSDLSALAELVGTPLRAKWGSYTGTGTNDHTINMGFRPVFALIYQGYSSYEYIVLLGEKGMFYTGTATSTINVEQDNDNYRIDPTNTGLRLRCIYSYDGAQQGAIYTCNRPNYPYYWFAIGV